MLTETGKITHINEMYITVQLLRKSGCKGCENESSCGVSSIAQAFSDSYHFVEIPTPKNHDFNLGDSITLSLPKESLNKATLLVYGLPLLGFFIGMLTPYLWLEHVTDATSIPCGLIGAFLGWIQAKSIAKQLESNLTPKITQPFNIISTL